MRPIKLTLIIGLSFSLSIFSQNIHEFDVLIADITIKQRLTYHVSIETNESKLIHITEIDRKKKEVHDKHMNKWESGYSWTVMEYDNEWKAIEKTSYISDSIRHFVNRFYYDELGNCIKQETYKSWKEDTFQILKPHNITEFYYNSKGKEIGYENTFFPNGDTLTWKKNKSEYFLNYDGLRKKENLYVARENSEEYELWRKVKIRYCLKGRKIKKYVVKDLETQTKRTSKSYYENGLIIKKKTYQDGILESTSEYKYENGLVKKNRIENFAPGVEMDFIVRYEYKK